MSATASPLAAHERRRALALGHVNAALWAAGNALTTGSLVSYLARDLGAQGLALSLVLAAPNLAGLLRLCAPGIIYRAGTARRACLWLSSLSYLLIVGLPAIALAGAGDFAIRGGLGHDRAAVRSPVARIPRHGRAVESGGAIWCRRRIRGRYFARRQMVQLAVSIPTLLASGYFADHWREAVQGRARAVAVGLCDSHRDWRRCCCWRRWCRWC